MAQHTVTLTYQGPTNFEAQPASIAVKPGDTIAFQLGPNSNLGAIHIRFRDRQFFTAANGHFHNDGLFVGGDGVVTVAHPLSATTTYHCQLVNGQGHVLSESQEVGGEIVPSTLSQ